MNGRYFVAMETLVIVIICRYLPFVENTSYLNWAINGVLVAEVVGVVTVSINAVAFREEFKGIFKMITGLFKKKKSE